MVQRHIKEPSAIQAGDVIAVAGPNWYAIAGEDAVENAPRVVYSEIWLLLSFVKPGAE